MERAARAGARGGARSTRPATGCERVREFAGAAGFATRVHRLRDGRAAHDGRRGRAARTAACSSSSSSRPSTRPAAGRCPTPASSSARRRLPRRAWRRSTALGDDQARRARARGGRAEAGRARAWRVVDLRARHATEANHTATHLLHAALRAAARHARAPGGLRRAAGQAALRLHPRQRADARGAERRRGPASTRWILENHPVRALTTTLDEAKRCGAMALFGEKYGDVVRMVEVGDGSFSRELCGGTHVRSTAEIGLFTDRHRDLERGERAAHRGADGAGGGGADARRATRRWRGCARAAHPPEQVAERGRAGCASVEEHGRAQPSAAMLDVDDCSPPRPRTSAAPGLA